MQTVEREADEAQQLPPQYQALLQQEYERGFAAGRAEALSQVSNLPPADCCVRTAETGLPALAAGSRRAEQGAGRAGGCA